MKLREEEFYEQYHQHGGTTIIPTEIFNELYDDATEEIERLNNIINEFDKWLDVNLFNLEKENANNTYDKGLKQGMLANGRLIKNKLQELKGSDKE